MSFCCLSSELAVADEIAFAGPARIFESEEQCRVKGRGAGPGQVLVSATKGRGATPARARCSATRGMCIGHARLEARRSLGAPA